VVLMLLAVVGRVSDLDLVERFKAGDRRAFDEIVERYQHRVYTLSLRWMGNDELAADVTQDVFIALFRSLHGFRGEAKLSTWVYRVVLNHTRNRKLYLRRRRFDQHEALEGEAVHRDGEAPVRQIAGDGPAPDEGLARGDAERWIRSALAELPQDQRELIVLRDLEDLSYEEIADLLDIPRGTVKSRLHRARVQLARVLSRTPDFQDLVPT
jgi:RNA polymerase sigma-70 factor (ECF subfamily)